MSKEVMRQALEKIATVNAMDYEYQAWAREALAEQPAPAQQEPVAWRWVNSKNWLTYGEMPHDKFESTPLYTSQTAQQEQNMNITTTYDEAMVKAMIAEAVAHCTKHGCVPKQPAPAQQEPVDAVWFQDANGALRKAPKDCQSFDANGVPIAVWVNGVWYPRPQAREPEQPAQQCKWPTCQSEEYQQALAEQIRRELVGEQPAQQQGRVRELECCIADLKAECQALRAEREPVALEEYDAGLLNDFGGGNVEWWQDYIRAELGRAYEHYQSQMATPQPPAQRQPLTDEQMWALWNSQGDDAMEQQAAIAFARAIEAAHNIKEHT